MPKPRKKTPPPPKPRPTPTPAAPPAKSANKTAAKPGRLKRLLFRLIAFIIVPLLVLVLLELGLRLTGVGYPGAPVILETFNGRKLWHDNPRFSRRFFPPAIAREFEPFTTPAEKAENVCRICIVGGSAAQGVPDAAFSFSRHLEVLLRSQYPGVRFEVVNAAMTAINSHVNREIISGLTRLKPDLFIIYMGNNEVVGPYGAGTIFTPLSGSLGTIRAGIRLKSLRLGQLLSQLTASFKKDRPPASWKGLELFMEKRVSHRDPRLETVYRHFNANLREMIQIARSGGAAVAAGSIAVNLKDCPPFASLHNPRLSEREKQQWESLFQQGTVSETAGDYSAAIGRYLEAEKTDGEYADLQYRMGRCFWETGNYTEAKKRFAAALHYDALRFRADQRINEIIRDAVTSAGDASVRLCDAEKIFELNSENGVPGERFFYEHVHLTFNGNYLLARGFLQEIEPLLPDFVKAKKNTAPLPGGAETASALAFTPWDRYSQMEDMLENYLRRPPHTNQSYHRERIRRMEGLLTQLSGALSPESLRESAAHLRLAMESNPDDPWFCKKYARLNALFLQDYSEAADQYRRLCALLPHSHEGPAGLGFALKELGKPDEAIQFLKKAAALHPYKPDIYNNLAIAWQKKGDYPSAETSFRRAFEINPAYTSAYSNLALLLMEQKRAEEAFAVCRTGAANNPSSWFLHHFTGMLCKRNGLNEEAEKWLRKAAELDPSAAETREALAELTPSPATPPAHTR